MFTRKKFLKLLQNWQENNTCVRAGLNLYWERDSSSCIFLWFYKMFLEHLLYTKFPCTCSIIITWSTNFLSFSFYWHSQCVFIGLLLHLAYVFVLLMEWLTVIQIVLTLTKFTLNVCLLIELPHSFLFRINELMKDGEKTWKLQ